MPVKRPPLTGKGWKLLEKGVTTKAKYATSKAALGVVGLAAGISASVIRNETKKTEKEIKKRSDTTLRGQNITLKEIAKKKQRAKIKARNNRLKRQKVQRQTKKNQAKVLNKGLKKR